MTSSTRTRWFTALSLLTVNRPGRVVAIVGLLTIVAGALIPGIGVTTSRYSLVSADNPYQARLFEFFERFGFPDTPVLVLSGGTDVERRRVVNRLEKHLEAEPMFAGRVMARIDPEKVAEIILLHQPEALTALRPFLPPDTEFADLIEGGLPAMTQVMARQIEAAVAADRLAILSPFSIGRGQTASDQAIAWLAVMARAFEASLSEEPAWPDIMVPAGAGLMPTDQGIDGRGYSVGTTGLHHMIPIFVDLPGDNIEQLRPVVERIRAIRDVVLAETANKDITIRLTGLPALSVDEHSVITRGLWQSSLAATIAILMLFFAVFRSVRQTIMALIPLLVGVVMTLASARLLFGQLNLITSASVAILLGLGIDFAVHATARYNEALRDGATPAAAVQTTLLRAGPAILTGAVTCALAFLTTTITEFTAFAELGVLTALGLAFTLVATLLLVPPLLVWGSKRQMPVSPEIPGMTRLAGAARNHPRLTLLLALVAALGGGIVLPGIEFNVRYFDFLPAHTESSIALGELEKETGMGPTFAFVSADNVEQARAMTAHLRALPTVAAVQSATDLIPKMDEERLRKLRMSLDTRPPNFSMLATSNATAEQLIAELQGVTRSIEGMRQFRKLGGRSTDSADAAISALETLRARLESLPDRGQPAIRALSERAAKILQRAWNAAVTVAARGSWLPSDLPELFRVRFASKDGKALALFVYPAGNVWNVDEAKRFRDDLETVDPKASGTAITLHEHSRMVLHGFQQAAVLAAVLIFLVLLLDFRSVKDTLLALAPLCCGWLWMLGAMGAFGIRFDFANIVALPLVPGIGVAAGVHLMHRCRQSQLEHGGVGILEDLLRGTGAAVFVAAVTTVFGFAGLMVADYGGMISLGLIMSIGVSSCLLGAIIVLPAILFLLGRVR